MALRDAPIAAALRAGLALGVAALGTGSTLAYFEESLPTSMNPLYASAMVDYRSQELVFDRLWFHDAITNELKSRIVERYELVDGGKGVRITLISGVKWHDGKPMNAKDLCFTVDAMLDKNTPSPVAQEYRQFITGCEVTSGQVATISFNRVFHNPRERLGFALLPREAFESTAISPDLEFSAKPIGTGPMKGSRGRRGAIFDAFANVHHTPQVAQLQLQDAGDPLVQVKTIINNGVQGIIAVPPPYRPDLSSNDEVALKSYDLRSWWFIALNTNKGALADPRVRKGLNLAIDRTALREFTIGVKAGEENSPCEFISGPFVQSSPYYNRAVPTVDRSNKAQAKALFEEAGLKDTGGRWHYKNAPITLRVGMLAPLNNEAPDLLSYIGNQLSDAGFDRNDLKISADEWKTNVLTGKATDYDLLIGKWSFGLYEDVNHLFHSRTGNAGKLNLFNYKNADVDATLQAYDRAVTDTAARDAYHKLHTQVAEDLPYLFLWKLDTRSAWRTEVRGNIISAYYYFTEIDSWKYGR